MGRLTQKDASGRWQVKGIPWEKLQEGEVITKETSQLLYGSFCKLKDYEDSGISPEQVTGLKDEAEDMAAYICDKLCRHPREITEQEELDAVCRSCPVDVYVKRILGMDQGGQGKLLKLPCAVGSLVYEPYQYMGDGAREIDVHKIRLEDLDRIGKTVFLTREEAEAVLKELREKEQNEIQQREVPGKCIGMGKAPVKGTC